MGLILDSSVLIAAERRLDSVAILIERLRHTLGDTESAISAITVVELTHGIYHARTPADRERRRTFTEDVIAGLIVHPVSLPIAQLPGVLKANKPLRGLQSPLKICSSEPPRFI